MSSDRLCTILKGFPAFSWSGLFPRVCMIVLLLLLTSCASTTDKPDEDLAPQDVTAEETIVGEEPTEEARPLTEVRTVEAVGVAAISGGNTALARDAAIDDALRKAVEQAVGTLVSAETLVESFEVLKDSVYTRSEGYVKDYAVLEESMGLDLYRVKVRARVAFGKISDDIDALGLLMRRAERPRVLFMIAEKSIGKKLYSFWWTGRSEFMGEVIDSSVAETAMKEIFLDKGFHVVDVSGSREVIEIRDQFRVADLTREATTSIGRDLNAEVVIYGKATVTEGPITPESSVGVYMADISVQAVRVDDGVVLASSTGHGTARHISGVTGSTIALERAGSELADKLINQITVKWSGPKIVTVKLSGIRDQSDISAFKDILRTRVRGVEAVYQRRFSGGVAVLEVESKTSAQEIADGLAGLRGVPARVTGTTANSIDVVYGE